MNYFAAENSIVNEYVKIGEGSKIWNLCNIYGHENNPIIIGKNTQIGSYCEIMPGVLIGSNCKIEPYVFLPEETSIGDYVFIGPGAKFMNDKYPSALKPTIRKWRPFPAKIEEKVVIGGGALIGPGVTIKRKSIIGMGAVVTKNVEPYSIIIKHNQKIGDIRDERFRNKYSELLE